MSKSHTETYLQNIAKYFKDEMSSEMSYRTAFQNYLETIFPKEKGYYIQHDPKAVSGNKPDYIILSRDRVPLLYIEVKEVGKNLDKVEKSSQASRYFGYTNLIISDYVEFRFYRNGESYQEAIELGKTNKKERSLVPEPNKGEFLSKTILDFMSSHKEPIKSGKHLAKIMGGKAQRIRDNTLALLKSDADVKKELEKIMNVIKESLISDLTIEKFADMYAQTLVYGLFAARYCDPTKDDFSRGEARDLIPSSNPFLRDFFDHIAGSSFPKALSLIVDELCEVFTHADVSALMGDYYKSAKSTSKTDPVIHFYEDFLQEYDPKKKVELGVFYTPHEVVRFIIRGVDEILKKKFDISNGLADSNKINSSIETIVRGKIKKIDKEFHRVQVLDFATGTGTFLNEVVDFVHNTFKGREGVWPAYVKSDLIPRMHGFELMMASYTIAHLKLGMTLQNTCSQVVDQRLGVYLTNTLDEAKQYSSGQDNIFGFMESISEESELASKVKKEYPVMVVVGNPPYSENSKNPQYKGHDVYKVEPGGNEKLKERNSKSLNDDYVKFISFAEKMIEKNGEGVMGIISAHGYIDNPTFRGMRWHLRKTFDEIYILDLHGNVNKKETSPDGSIDQNVFDIRTGVAIIFCIKNKRTGGKKELARLFQYDVFGERQEKFKYLDKESIQSISWNELPAITDVWKVEGEGKVKYEKGFSLNELFIETGNGVVTARDGFVVSHNKQKLLKNARLFQNLEARNEEELCVAVGISNKKGWDAIEAQKTLQKSDDLEVYLKRISYRPFDTSWIFYHKSLVWRPADKIMHHLVGGKNTALVFARSQKNPSWNAIFVTENISDAKLGEASTQSRIAPLYVINDNQEKHPNLDRDIWEKINLIAGQTSPDEVFNYVYAYLHSPSYRRNMNEFLKSDFPRVPLPSDKEMFWKLSSLGLQLRELHLLKSPDISKLITTFPVEGDEVIGKQKFNDGKVYINDEQYFGGISEDAWNFQIGGYKPLQKYLKDRKGEALALDEIQNYEKMVVAITRTIEIMSEIDEVYKV